MELIFEVFTEIIIQPIAQGYAFVMMLFANGNKKINRNKVRAFVVFECILLLALFAVGAVMLLETSSESILGKILLFLSLGISALQIIIGCILKIINKEK